MCEFATWREVKSRANLSLPSAQGNLGLRNLGLGNHQELQDFQKALLGNPIIYSNCANEETSL